MELKVYKGTELVGTGSAEAKVFVALEPNEYPAGTFVGKVFDGDTEIASYEFPAFTVEDKVKPGDNVIDTARTPFVLFDSIDVDTDADIIDTNTGQPSGDKVHVFKGHTITTDVDLSKLPAGLKVSMVNNNLVLNVELAALTGQPLQFGAYSQKITDVKQNISNYDDVVAGISIRKEDLTNDNLLLELSDQKVNLKMIDDYTLQINGTAGNGNAYSNQSVPGQGSVSDAFAIQSITAY
ncbi:hypothetical protein [Lentilactobacillus sp. Marseille-Q4993]|uniref:hypothetical protein n=1 Tax=Lentilactobacillus sp. Marseille-Q4993 TaxID=3039492 RepID=UPI0024BD3799|nr:hypothetical protein [Lentilactobacillus sp. Marseille-Q4993]